MRYLIIFFIAMLPLAELRIAIPTGLTMNVPIIQTYIISLIGNILPLPFVFYFSQKILSWGKDKKYIGSFFTFCLEKGKQVYWSWISKKALEHASVEFCWRV